MLKYDSIQQSVFKTIRNEANRNNTLPVPQGSYEYSPMQNHKLSYEIGGGGIFCDSIAWSSSMNSVEVLHCELCR